MRLRIIAGDLGGRWIEAPAGRATRPTAERVREAWFSALGDRVIEARVIDLFAGSGALGLEALSRGAAHTHFVESDRLALATLRRNVANLGVEGRATVVKTDAFRFLDGLGAEGSAFDRSFEIALVDPPYGTGVSERIVLMFEAAPFADLLCIERPTDDPDLPCPADWQRRYGDTLLSFVTAPGRASGRPRNRQITSKEI